jgi:hypothetical protein
VLLARNHSYQLPEAIGQVGAADQTFVDNERMGIATNELGPVQRDTQDRAKRTFAGAANSVSNAIAGHPQGSITPPGNPADLQNALVRLGARHLQERADVLPKAALEDVTAVLREALVSGTPRMVSTGARG